jgi:hypothetical protein
LIPPGRDTGKLHKFRLDVESDLPLPNSHSLGKIKVRAVCSETLYDEDISRSGSALKEDSF